MLCRFLCTIVTHHVWGKRKPGKRGQYHLRDPCDPKCVGGYRQNRVKFFYEWSTLVHIVCCFLFLLVARVGGGLWDTPSPLHPAIAELSMFRGRDRWNSDVYPCGAGYPALDVISVMMIIIITTIARTRTTTITTTTITTTTTTTITITIIIKIIKMIIIIVVAGARVSQQQ